MKYLYLLFLYCFFISSSFAASSVQIMHGHGDVFYVRNMRSGETLGMYDTQGYHSFQNNRKHMEANDIHSAPSALTIKNSKEKTPIPVTQNSIDYKAPVEIKENSSIQDVGLRHAF